MVLCSSYSTVIGAKARHLEALHNLKVFNVQKILWSDRNNTDKIEIRDPRVPQHLSYSDCNINHVHPRYCICIEIIMFGLLVCIESGTSMTNKELLTLQRGVRPCFTWRTPTPPPTPVCPTPPSHSTANVAIASSTAPAKRRSPVNQTCGGRSLTTAKVIIISRIIAEIIPALKSGRLPQGRLRHIYMAFGLLQRCQLVRLTDFRC